MTACWWSCHRVGSGQDGEKLTRMLWLELEWARAGKLESPIYTIMIQGKVNIITGKLETKYPVYTPV